MKSPQLVCGAAVLAALSLSPACNRSETKADARQAADGVRTAAARAGDKLADGWLTTKVQAKYFADRDIKARYIDVSSDGGVVTLSGYVDSDRARAQAVQLARDTDGVKSVTDRLLIGRAPAAAAHAGRQDDVVATTGSADRAASSAVERIDDARITTMIQAKFFVDSGVKGRRIDVDTRDGVVTLRGDVASEAERGQALLIARNTEGVQRVEDNLSVNAAIDTPAPAAPASEDETATSKIGGQIEDGVITTKIKTRLLGDSLAKATSIDVTTTNGVVSLEGTVPSSEARQRAITIARETDGVSQVVDRLTVQRARK